MILLCLCHTMTRGQFFYVELRHNLYESGGSLGGLPASLRAVKVMTYYASWRGDAGGLL